MADDRTREHARDDLKYALIGLPWSRTEVNYFLDALDAYLKAKENSPPSPQPDTEAR